MRLLAALALGIVISTVSSVAGIASAPTRLTVDGPRLIDPDGQEIRLTGMNFVRVEWWGRGWGW